MCLCRLRVSIAIYIDSYGSKYLLRKHLGYDLGGEVPSQTAFGSIGDMQGYKPIEVLDIHGAIQLIFHISYLYNQYVSPGISGDTHSVYIYIYTQILLYNKYIHIIGGYNPLTK